MRATWFEIPVNDMDRAKKFYESVLSIQFGNDMAIGNAAMCFFPSENEEQGSPGALIQQDSYTPSHQGTLVYLSVKEINDVTPKIKKSGGKLINEKVSIGEHGFVAHLEDSEGNRVALHQPV